MDLGLPWNNLSWGYWDYSFVPTVSSTSGWSRATW